jgi:hypothetical protein
LVHFDSHLRDFSLVLNDFLFKFRPLLHDYFNKSRTGLPDLFQCCQRQLLQFSNAISAFSSSMQSDLAFFRRQFQPSFHDFAQQSRPIDRIYNNSATILCTNLDSRFELLESNFIKLVNLINSNFASISSPVVQDSSNSCPPVLSSISPSAQIALNLSLAEFEPRGEINDFDTCRQFIYFFVVIKSLEVV